MGRAGDAGDSHPLGLVALWPASQVSAQVPSRIEREDWGDEESRVDLVGKFERVMNVLLPWG